ncbi:MAG: hypothetical protein IPG45_29065 [Deltaproteobacteria bacterium]|nr:hypothetical protein [Deltaproteobacteria bacterium]
MNALKTVMGGLLLAGLCGCTLPTTIAIQRFEKPRGFRACAVQLSWAEAELLQECGSPVAEVTRRPNGERCLVYHSDAQGIGYGAFAGAELSVATAPVVVVCLREGLAKKQRVSSVFGMKAPRERLVRTSTTAR